MFAQRKVSGTTRAFTLIELMVVISIIAVLAGLLFPVFAKARERAVQSRSLNNVRQLALAFQEYAGDNDDRLPGWASGTTTYVHNVWDEQIDPLIRNKDVYSNGDRGIASPSQPMPWDRTLTYVLNGALISPWASGNVDFSRMRTPSLSAVRNRAGTILLAEVATDAGFVPATTPNPVPMHFSGTGGASKRYATAVGGRTGTGGPIDADPKLWVEQGKGAAAYSPAVVWGPGIATSTMGIGRNLHGGGACYAFVDGHVRNLRIDESTTSGMAIPGGPSANWEAGADTIRFNMWYPG